MFLYFFFKKICLWQQYYNLLSNRQVLVNFSEELDDETIDAAAFGQGSRNSMPNMYSSTDVIHMDTF